MMRHDLYYNIDVDNYEDLVPSNSDIDISNFHGGEYTYSVEENLQDILDYLFLTKYGITISDNLGWYLEDGAKEFVKDIENKYWSNTLDTLRIYQDYHFIDFLKDRYENEAIQECFNEEVARSHLQ